MHQENSSSAIADYSPCEDRRHIVKSHGVTKSRDFRFSIFQSLRTVIDIKFLNTEYFNIHSPSFEASWDPTITTSYQSIYRGYDKQRYLSKLFNLFIKPNLGGFTPHKAIEHVAVIIGITGLMPHFNEVTIWRRPPIDTICVQPISSALRTLHGILPE